MRLIGLQSLFVISGGAPGDPRAVGPLGRGAWPAQPLGHACCRRGVAPCREAFGPVDYADYLRRQNARDPSPTLADVFERSNLAGLPTPAWNGAPADASDRRRPPSRDGTDAARRSASSDRPDDIARRLYGAPRLGDVTPTACPAAMEPGARAAAPATITRGRLVDVVA